MTGEHAPQSETENIRGAAARRDGWRRSRSFEHESARICSQRGDIAVLQYERRWWHPAAWPHHSAAAKQHNIYHYMVVPGTIIVPNRPLALSPLQLNEHAVLLLLLCFAIILENESTTANRK
jgi:hypothetical protein